MITFFF